MIIPGLLFEKWPLFSEKFDTKSNHYEYGLKNETSIKPKLFVLSELRHVFTNEATHPRFYVEFI